MAAQTLLSDLAGRGATLVAEAGRLRVDAPAGALTDTDRQRIRDHKPALLKLLAAPPEDPPPPRYPPPRYPAPGVAPSRDLAGLVSCIRDPEAARYVLLLAWREASAEAAASCTGDARRGALARVARYDRDIAAVVAAAGAYREGDWQVFPNAGGTGLSDDPPRFDRVRGTLFGCLTLLPCNDPRYRLYYSDLLGEIIGVSDVDRPEDAEPEPLAVNYTLAELERMRGLPPDAVKAIHRAKNDRGGRYTGPAVPEEEQ